MTPKGIFLFMIFVFGVMVTVYPLTTPYPQLSLISIIFLGAIVILPRPSLIFYIILFMIPFGSYRSLVTIGPIKIHWLLSLSLLVIAFFTVVLQKGFPKKTLSNLWAYMGLLVVWGLICTFYSPFRAVAVKEVFLLVFGFLFSVLGFFFINENGYRTIIPRIIITSITLGSVLACVGFFASTTQGMSNRSSGATSNPNVLAITVIYGMPFVAHMFFNTKSNLKKIFALSIGGINFLGMVTAYSRSGAMTLVLMGGVCAYVYRKHIHIKQLGFIGLAGLAVIVSAYVVIPQSYWERQVSVVDTKAKSMSRRGSYIDVAKAAFKISPVLGFGTGTFREVFARSEETKRYARTFEERTRYAHNTYLEFLVGMGLPGLLLFGILILRVSKNFYSAIIIFKNRDEQLAEISITYLLGFVFTMLYLAVLSDMQQKYMLISFALSQIGYFLAMELRNKDENINC